MKLISRLKITGLATMIALLGSVSFAQAQDKVSDAELNKFAAAFADVQMENQKVQQEMMTLITENGMEVQRFSTIQQQTTNPDVEVEATAEEQKAFQTIMGEINEMQPQIEARMEKLVAASGITVERFQEIGQDLQTNKELQGRLQAIMTADAANN